MREWEREAKADKTWPEWKLLYKNSYELQQLAFQVSDGANQFSASNVATQAQSFAATQPTFRFDSQPPVEPTKFYRLDTYLDNLANSTTNKRAVLSPLTTTIAKLTTTNA